MNCSNEVLYFFRSSGTNANNGAKSISPSWYEKEKKKNPSFHGL